MSIEQLMQIEVTSVSKTNQPLAHSAAAIYVITDEDIRRSGATNIPDLLRMVPGLDVAQINAHTWAISARGFNGRFSNKLLVLVDGRTVYSPLFSGVYWDMQDVPLEDIDRIEVIRGPGAALWGANAVNGVINIIMKKAKDTQGGLVRARGGSSVLGAGTIRYGGEIGPDVHYRVYGKYFRNNHFELAGGGSGLDQWQMERSGFRVDWDSTSGDSITLEGDFGGGSESEKLLKFVSFTPPFTRLITDPIEATEENILARWNHTLSGGSKLSLQLYFDRTNRGEATFGENRNTYDADLEHNISLGDRHNLIWGLGYRWTSDEIGASFGESFTPQARGIQLFSAFAQDEIKLVENHLTLTLGSKFERNDFTGFEIQPNVRAMWTVNSRHALWGSIARAVRSPDRAEADVQFVQQAVPLGGGAVGFATIFGDPDFLSEDLVAYEGGYRVQLLKNLSLDFAGYFNGYTNLETTEPGTPFIQQNPAPPHLILPLFFDNRKHGSTHGVEISGNWYVTKKWRISPSYTWIAEDLRLNAGSLASPPPRNTGDDPGNQFQVRSLIDLPKHLEFDSSFQYVSRLPAQALSGYTRFDTRLGWRPRDSFELSAVVQNAFSAQHAEFTRSVLGEVPTLVPRSAYLQVTWRFETKK